MVTTSSTTSLSAAIIEIDDNDDKQVTARKSPTPKRARNGVMATPDDRDQDIAKLRRMMLLTSAIVLGMLVNVVLSDLFPFVLDYFALPFSLVLMGFWVVFFIITTTGVLTKRYLLRLYVIMGLFVALSGHARHLSWYMFSVLALVIVVMQVTVLVSTLQSAPPPETGLQKPFIGTLNVVCAIAAMLSIVFTFFSVIAWPSISSLDSAVASFFSFAYASFIASKIAGARGHVTDATIICSCDAVPGYIDNPNLWCMGSLSIFGNALAAVAFVCLWPPYLDRPNTWTVGGALIPAFFGIQAYVHQTRLLRGRRFHVRSDASILVETMCKTYAYPNAVCAILEPADARLPKQTGKCHVYCARMNVQTVIIELAGGRVLCLAPAYPSEFLDAANRAINDSRAF